MVRHAQPGFSGRAHFFFPHYSTVCKPVGDIRSCRYQYSRRAAISQYTLSFAAPPPLRPTTLGGEARTAGLAGSTIAILSRRWLPLPTFHPPLCEDLDCWPWPSCLLVAASARLACTHTLPCFAARFLTSLKNFVPGTVICPLWRRNRPQRTDQNQCVRQDANQGWKLIRLEGKEQRQPAVHLHKIAEGTAHKHRKRW